jgi:glycosyltransferase involved in cell wall biosynthesis
MKLWRVKGAAFYAEYNLRLLLYLLGQGLKGKRPEVVVANDLDTLLACWLGARLLGARLVYDSHEIFTEVPELIHRPQVQAVWRWLEQRLVPRVDVMYTVNPSLASHYHDLYQIPVASVRNVPFFRRPEPRSLPPEGQPITLLYQGAINIGRGLELMVQALHHLPKNYILWIIGRGDIEADLAALIAREGLAQRTEMLGFIPLERLSAITREATLGLSLEEDLGANYHFASPNKVFDYLQSGIPSLVSDLPEMAGLARQYGCSAVLPNDQRTPQGLAAAIQAICQSPEGYAEMSRNCCMAAPELCWEREQGRMIAEIYSMSLSNTLG